jgi:hypothetical protein
VDPPPRQSSLTVSHDDALHGCEPPRPAPGLAVLSMLTELATMAATFGPGVAEALIPLVNDEVNAS